MAGNSRPVPREARRRHHFDRTTLQGISLTSSLDHAQPASFLLRAKRRRSFLSNLLFGVPPAAARIVVQSCEFIKQKGKTLGEAAAWGKMHRAAALLVAALAASADCAAHAPSSISGGRDARGISLMEPAMRMPLLGGHRRGLVVAAARSPPAKRGGKNAGPPKGPIDSIKEATGNLKLFEKLPPKFKGPAINAWSAMVAGFGAYFVATPLETIKTGLQTMPGSTALGIVQNKGAGGLFYGLGAMFWAGVPYSIVMYSVYQPIKSSVQDLVGPAAGILAAMLGAAAAESVGALFFLPGELVSKRMMRNPGMYSSFPMAAKTIIGSEGVKGLYRGLVSTLIRDVPFTIIQFIVFEELRKEVANYHARSVAGKKNKGAAAAPVSFGESVAVGVAAALVATTATLPLDVIKSNIQTDAAKQTFMSMTNTLVRTGGVGSLFRGFGPYAAINAAKWSTSMAVYNTVREFHGEAPSSGGGH
jgi:solute carrier family 25 S-adenosylmethionine transporter 26